MIKTTALCRVFYALKIPDHLLADSVTHDFGNFRKPNGPVITTRAAGYVCRPEARTEVGIRWPRMGCHRRLALVQPGGTYAGAGDAGFGAAVCCSFFSSFSEISGPRADSRAQPDTQ